MGLNAGTPLSAAPSVAPQGLPEPVLLLVLLADFVGWQWNYCKADKRACFIGCWIPWASSLAHSRQLEA